MVDVGVGYVWMAALIFLAGRAAKIDARSGADTSAIDELKERIARFQAEHERIPSLTDLMLIVAVAFGGVGLSHAIGAPLAAWFKANVSWASQFSLDAPFVWVVVLSTTLGLSLSFTRARTLEGAGASRLGSLLLYFLIACIGMQMDLLALLDRPWLFLLGLIWIAVHIVLLWCLGKLLKVPFFYSPSVRSRTSVDRPRRRWWPRRSIRHWRRWACCWARWATLPARTWLTSSASPCARWQGRADGVVPAAGRQPGDARIEVEPQGCVLPCTPMSAHSPMTHRRSAPIPGNRARGIHARAGFGFHRANQHVRLAYTQEVPRLQEAVARIARGLQRWQGSR